MGYYPIDEDEDFDNDDDIYNVGWEREYSSETKDDAKRNNSDIQDNREVCTRVQKES